MHADLLALNAQFHTAAATLTALTTEETPMTAAPTAQPTRFSPTKEQAATYYAALARQAEEGAATTLRLKVLRLTRKGWTQEAALAHVEGACDQSLCTGEHR